MLQLEIDLEENLTQMLGFFPIQNLLLNPFMYSRFSIFVSVIIGQICI